MEFQRLQALVIEQAQEIERLRQEREEARRAARRYVRSTACPEYHLHRYPWLGEEE